MSDSKHTPGPWSIGTQQYRLSCLDDGDAAIPYDAVAIVSKIDNPLYSRNVASVDFDLGNDTESEANARLIAAAPVLLEACEKITKVKQCHEIDYALVAIEKAIAKAKGEQD